MYQIAKADYIEIATQLAKRLLEEKTPPSTNFLNIVATLGAICTMDESMPFLKIFFVISF